MYSNARPFFRLLVATTRPPPHNPHVANPNASCGLTFSDGNCDSRAARFIARHGRLVQVELDALPPEVLRALYTDAIGAFWNDDVYAKALAREAAERRTLKR